MNNDIRELLSGASPAPWTIKDDNYGCKQVVDANGEEVVYTPGLSNEAQDLSNVELICMIRNLLHAADEATMDAWEQKMEAYDESGTL